RLSLPYILSPLIKVGTEGMWGEGVAYSKKQIYGISNEKLPPVNYDEHIIKSHSITHIEFPNHTQIDGEKLSDFLPSKPNYFYGPSTVVRLKENKYKNIKNEIFHWEVQLNDLKEAVESQVDPERLEKLLITSDFCPENKSGFHDPNYVLTLSLESAEWLINLPKFNLFGTSWKSSDYAPGSMQRPIHNTLFKRALIVENLILSKVPEGNYFLVCIPIMLAGSSESPVTPVLFNAHELT
ncbi:MAG: hypothetical protein ACK5V3_06165, partial [Bdellovibrionales bacterium]